LGTPAGAGSIGKNGALPLNVAYTLKITGMQLTWKPIAVPATWFILVHRHDT
jgi:hypothetical protein